MTTAPTTPSATLYGVGLGPGDPELLTIKAVRVIQSVPVLAWPAPETGDSLARAIAAPWLPGGQIEVAIRMPMVTERFPAQEVYNQAAADIAGHLEAGRAVAVLCEGDPFFYGSFLYLYARLAARHPAVVIPGVCSLTACAAAAGMALAGRNDVLTVIPAPLPAAQVRERLLATDAAAILKVGRHLSKVRAVLEDCGVLEQAWLVERASLPDQRVRPLATVTDAQAPYFSMILVHRRGAGA